MTFYVVEVTIVGFRLGCRFYRATPALIPKTSGTDARNPLKNRQLDVLEVPSEPMGFRGTSHLTLY